MKNTQQGNPEQAGPEDSERLQDGELLRARELIARTMRFLAHCAEDPEEAMRSDDPQALAHDLRALAVDPTVGAAPSEQTSESRTIQIRHRRSA